MVLLEFLLIDVGAVVAATIKNVEREGFFNVGPTKKGKEMSYSFGVKAANKAEAKAAVAAKFDEVVSQQPSHAKDKDAVLANASAVIDLLADDENKDVSVSCNGYISWNGTDADDNPLLTAASITSGASLVDREPAPTPAPESASAAA